MAGLRRVIQPCSQAPLLRPERDGYESEPGSEVGWTEAVFC